MSDVDVEFAPGRDFHEVQLGERLATPSSAGPERSPASRAWLVDGADLLSEPDPGPTPWLVEHMIVDQALVACVGRWKTTKSYALLHLCVSIASGSPAFGRFAVPKPGSVVFCNEESGRAALWRRLDALARGSAIEPEALRGRLMVAANSRVKLDDPGWQAELIAVGRELQPRLFVFDPLARMKAAAREENAQKEMSVVVEFLRELRHETAAAVAFVQHQGHAGAHMRGSSDLESVWESRLAWTREGQSPQVKLESEHREAEAGEPLTYRIAWDGLTRSMRFELVRDESGPSLEERIVEWLREHGPGTTDDVRRGVGVRKSDVQRTLETLETAGTTHRGRSGRRDQLGRPIADKVWNLATEAGLWPVPDLGPTGTTHTTGHCGRSEGGEKPVGLSPRDQPPEQPPGEQER